MVSYAQLWEKSDNLIHAALGNKEHAQVLFTMISQMTHLFWTGRTVKCIAGMNDVLQDLNDRFGMQPTTTTNSHAHAQPVPRTMPNRGNAACHHNCLPPCNEELMQKHARGGNVCQFCQVPSLTHKNINSCP